MATTAGTKIDDNGIPFHWVPAHQVRPGQTISWISGKKGGGTTTRYMLIGDFTNEGGRMHFIDSEQYDLIDFNENSLVRVLGIS